MPGIQTAAWAGGGFRSAPQPGMESYRGSNAGGCGTVGGRMALLRNAGHARLLGACCQRAEGHVSVGASPVPDAWFAIVLGNVGTVSAAGILALCYYGSAGVDCCAARLEK